MSWREDRGTGGVTKNDSGKVKSCPHNIININKLIWTDPCQAEYCNYVHNIPYTTAHSWHSVWLVQVF